MTNAQIKEIADTISKAYPELTFDYESIMVDGTSLELMSDQDDAKNITDLLNKTRRDMFPTLTEIISDAHASKKEVKPTSEGVDGIIADIRSQGLATDKEQLLIKMVVPGFKPGYFRFFTNSTSENGYEFGKRILSELSPELLQALITRDKLNVRCFLHTDEGHDTLHKLIGQKVRITVKEGQPDGNQGKFPNEWVPNPIERKPISKDAFLSIVAEQAETNDHVRETAIDTEAGSYS